MNRHTFREYDIRGVAESDLTDDFAERLGRAFATRLQRERGSARVVIARDARVSSPRLADALSRGLTGVGADVADGGLVPTPCLYHGVVSLEADGGIMVTGSHNPADMNGFKMSIGTASIHGQAIQDLADMMETADFETGAGSRRDLDLFGPYVAMLGERIRLDRPLKVVLDAGNGAGGPAALAFLEKAGVDLVPLYCEPDGTFPNHPADPTVLANLEDLIDRVRAENADIGIGLDGDADRVGVVDNLGRVLFGDRLLALFAREILDESHAGAPIIFEVKCSQALVEDIEAHGGRPIMWKTGHSLIKSKMKETDSPLAGEMSGHMFFADEYFGYDDGIYAAGRILRILASQEGPLCDLVDTVPDYPSTPEIRLDCPDEFKFGIVERVREDFRNTHDVVDIDGVRVLFGDGWGLVRASNTQPVIVLRFEAHSRERLKEISAEVLARVERLGGLDVSSILV